MQIPEKLTERLKKLGLDESIYDQRSRKCILSRETLDLEKFHWYENAYYMDENFDAKNYYVFDPVSLVPCLALDPRTGETILDMCAAPGTKTYIISFLANNEARIVANDINKLRIRRLVSNINRFHISAEVSAVSGRKLKGSRNDAKGVYTLYNKIILDAPCSGEGMINKHKKMFESWSEKRIKILSKKQKKLIKRAFELLEKNGTLVYSTCTFAPEENEEVIDFLLKKFRNAKLENIDIQNLNHANGLTEWNGKEYSKEIEKCLRIYPHHNSTGGFFVCKIRKI